MGTLGALSSQEDKMVFAMYVDEAVKRLRPKNILVYGTAPERIFHAALEAGCNIISYPTQSAIAHKKGEA